MKVVKAVAPTAGAVAAMTATEVAASGYERALFILQTGAAATGATIDFKIQAATASGGSFADITNAALTQITAAAGAGKVFAIDVAIPAGKNFLKVVGAVGTDTFANGAVCVLYRGVSYPVDTAYFTELVTV
jgi:hypothetical protein